MVPASDRCDFDPTPLVRLPWGSTSTRRTFCPAMASDVARLMAVVVLPTPPFWFATATIRPFGLFCSGIRQKYVCAALLLRLAELNLVLSGSIVKLVSRETGREFSGTMFHVERWARPSIRLLNTTSRLPWLSSRGNVAFQERGGTSAPGEPAPDAARNRNTSPPGFTNA